MSAPAAQKTIKDWQTTTASWWCPGCGDFGVLAALQRALANLGYENHEVTVVSGIGCSGKLSGYIKSYSYHSLHGRALPPAQAMKLANQGQKVIVVGGDGDGYGIGAGHFVLAAGGTFLGQGFSGDQKGLAQLYQDAIEHPGFAMVNTFSPCVTFNKVQTYQFYRDALVTLDGVKVPHD